MGERGFSLIELLAIIAVMGILLAIGTLQFNQYSRKANIESQVRTMYADLLKARSEAFMQKESRSFTVTGTSGTQFKVYPSDDGSGTPVLDRTFKSTVVFDNNNTISFNSRGMASGTKTVCVEPLGNPAYIDSIKITETMIQLGKWREGTCSSDHITSR